MKNDFSKQELKKIYRILKSYETDLLVNPTEEWELDFFDQPLADKIGLEKILKKIKDSLP